MVCINAECVEIEKVVVSQPEDFTLIYVAIAVLVVLVATAYYYKRM